MGLVVIRLAGDDGGLYDQLYDVSSDLVSNSYTPVTKIAVGEEGEASLVDENTPLPVEISTEEVAVSITNALPVKLSLGTYLVGDSNPVPVTLGSTGIDSALGDAFGRLRISEPHTIFDSKLSNGPLPLVWDDQEETGSGTSSTHSADKASVTIAVSDATAGKRTRQTFDRFNYQPAKSQLILMSVSDIESTSGITKCAGYFDDNNGVFFRHQDGVAAFVIRSKRTGSAVDTAVLAANWNQGSTTVFDYSKAQIIAIDLEWLGVGRVRVGFVINGMIEYVHYFNQANVADGVYMSSPNLPLRYQIENDGGGAVDSMECICGSVMSEGGLDPIGLVFCADTGTTHIDATVADTQYMIVAVRLKSDHLGSDVELGGFSMLDEQGNDFRWALMLNPTIAGSPSYSSVNASSGVEAAIGSTATTVTGGTTLLSGYRQGSSGNVGSSVADAIHNARRLGAAIDNTVDVIALTCTPLSANSDVQASLYWREVS